MEEFKAIETQEQLNAIIGERLKRSEKQYSEEKANLQKEIETLKANNAALNETISKHTDKTKEYDNVIAELQGKVKKYESDSVKQKIAREAGIPYEMADRLRGESEEELKADAELIKTFMPKAAAPQRSTASAGSEGGLDAAFASMVSEMNK